MSQERIRPKVVVRDLSPNHYQGRGQAPTLILLHDTEGHNVHGAADLEAVGRIFAGPEPGTSCHVCTDGEGQSGRYVPDEDAAWQAVAYNRAALGIEQIGFAIQTEWPTAQLRETARWIARWSYLYGIPIRKAWTTRGRVLRSGVTTHRKLGASGGGHTDPGLHYPTGRVLDLARHYRRRLEAADHRR